MPQDCMQHRHAYIACINLALRACLPQDHTLGCGYACHKVTRSTGAHASMHQLCAAGMHVEKLHTAQVRMHHAHQPCTAGMHTARSHAWVWACMPQDRTQYRLVQEDPADGRNCVEALVPAQQACPALLPLLDHCHPCPPLARAPMSFCVWPSRALVLLSERLPAKPL